MRRFRFTTKSANCYFEPNEMCYVNVAVKNYIAVIILEKLCKQGDAIRKNYVNKVTTILEILEMSGNFV